MKFGDPFVRVQSQQELKITECVAAYNASDKDKVAHIDKREEVRRKWKEYHGNARIHRAGVSKGSSSKSKNPS